MAWATALDIAYFEEFVDCGSSFLTLLWIAPWAHTICASRCLMSFPFIVDNLRITQSTWVELVSMQDKNIRT